MTGELSEQDNGAVATAARVLLLVDAPSTRQLLSAWLSPSYDVVEVASDEVLDGDFDLCILDDATHRRLWARISERKQASHPVFLPAVLVTAGLPDDDSPQTPTHDIDAVLALPIEPDMLLSQVAGLLERRAGSVALAESRDEALDGLLETRKHLELELERAENLRDTAESLLDADQRRMDLAERLDDINRLVHSSLEYEDILRRALTESAAAFDADGSAILVLEDGQWVFRYVDRLAPELVGQSLDIDEMQFLREIIASKQPLEVMDVDTDERVIRIEGPAFESVTSLLWVPLVVRGEVTGLLGVGFDSPRRLTEPELEFARKLRASVSAALENARLYQAEREAATRATFLQEIAAAASRPTGQREVAEQFLNTARRLLAPTAGSVDELDESAGVLRRIASFGTDVEVGAVFDVTPIDGPFSAALAVMNNRTMTHETAELPAGTRERERLAGVADRAWIVAPILASDRVIGTITLAYEQRRSFPAAEVELLEDAAALLGVSMEKSRLYEDAVRNADLAKALAAVDADIHSTMASDEIIQHALDRGVEALGCDAGAVELKDDGGWRVRFQRGFHDHDTGRLLSAQEAPSASRTELTGIPMQVEDLAADPSLNVGFAAEHDLRAVLAVPMSFRDSVIGALLFYERSRTRTFQETEVDFASRLSAAVTLALENASLVEQLRESGQRVADILDSIADGFVSLDRNWRYTLVNARAAEMLGRTPEDLLGKSMAAEYPDIDAWPHYREVMDSRTPAVFEVHSKPIGGWLEVHAYPASDGISIFFSDISARRTAELALRHRNALLQGVNAVLDAAIHADSEEEVGHACLAVVEELTDSTIGLIGEVGGDGLHDIAVSNPGWDACRALDASAHGGRGPFAIHGVYGRVLSDARGFYTNDPATHPDSVGLPDGHPPLESFMGAPLMWGGKVWGMVAVGNRTGGYEDDHLQTLEALAPAVVEALFRKRAEEELATATRRLDEHIANSPLAIVEFDAGFRVTRWSNEAEDLFGWKSDEVLGKSIAELDWVYPDDAALVEQESAALFSGQRPRSLNINRNVRKDGSVIWCEWYSSAVYDARGDLLSVFSQVLDVTERKRAESALRQSEQRLRAMMDVMPIGVALAGPHGEYVDVNEESARIWGTTDLPKPLDVAGYSAFKGFDPMTHAPLLPGDWPIAEAIETGERVIDRVIDFERFDGTSGTQSVSAVPIRDDDGNVTGAVATTLDISDRRQRQRFDKTLNEIGTAISSTFEIDEILARLHGMASAAMGADVAAVAVLERGRWVLKRADGIDEDVIRAALESGAVPAPPVDATRFSPVVIDDVGSHQRLAPLAKLRIEHVLAAPLLVGGDIFGVLDFATRRRGRAFTRAQVDFAARLMPLATVALENALLYQREHNIAEALQEAIMAPLKPIEGIEASYLYRAASRSANVGGDFYDVFELPERRIAIAVGDVSGKGLEAARLTSLVRDGIRAYALEDHDPGRVLGRVNELMTRSSDVGMFATVLLAVLDRAESLLTYTTAGHPPAVVAHKAGVEFLKSTESPIVGAFEGAAYRTAATGFGVDDRLVLYTDGVIEARRDGEMFGEDRLLKAVRKLRRSPVAETPHALLDRVLEFSGGSLQDDTVIMCVRRTA